jgi:hypothetical protein
VHGGTAIGLKKLQGKVTARFQELEDQGRQVPISQPGPGRGSPQVDTEAFQRWASSALHLIASVYGEASPHYKNLDAAYSQATMYTTVRLIEMRGVFGGAKSDFDGGYLFNIERVVSGELFADFVVAAKTALSEDHKDVAAVLACAALEDALKRLATANGIAVNQKGMTDVINALKAAALVSGSQKSLLDTMPKLRDAAMHADWNRITPQDVGSVIGYVEQFLLTHFQ